MTPLQTRYVVVETAISVGINTVISIAFVYLVFGGAATISSAALVPDALPQSFMIALMSTIVPTLLTRKRLRAGSVAPASRQVPTLLRTLPVRALVIALAAAAAGLAIHAILFGSLLPHRLSFGSALIFKAAYGAILAAIVTLVTLRIALAEELS